MADGRQQPIVSQHVADAPEGNAAGIARPAI